MVHSVKFVLSFVAMIAVAWMTAPAQAAPAMRVDHVALSVALERPLQPGGSSWIAVRQDIDPGWHTYWRNPGDAGLATRFDWHLPQGVSAGAVEWPVPEEFSDGTVVNYGYAGRATLLVPLRASIRAVAGVATVHVTLLECQHMCIPEDATLDVDLRAASGSAQDFRDARAAMPAAYRGQVRAVRRDGRLIVNLPGFLLSSLSGARILPATPHLVGSGGRLTAMRNENGLEWSAPLATHRPLPARFAGLLIVPGARAQAFEAPIDLPAVPSSTGGSTLLPAILLAFLGGLVLNIMPCVLPILSMKALMLAQSGETLAEARRDALAYGAGVLTTFMLIATTLIALKAGGAAIGWGFQLQSPFVVLGLAILMAAIGFNLFDLFEVPLALAGIGDGLTRKAGASGAFFTGILAVLVASPCTAPFMGTALGFALTQPALVAFAVFLALGIGFAMPLAAISCIPHFSGLIPRPGAWMQRVRQFLAFPMFATAIWLLWVLGEQSGPLGMALGLATCLGLVFVMWALHVSRGGWRAASVCAGLVLAALAASRISAQAGDNDIHWAAWSPAAVADARLSGHPVLVDFSAAWCLTCLINERVALHDPAVVAALRRDHVATFKADWTNRDSEIATELAAHGRDGVPLYLLYASDPTSPPQILPQILTPSSVNESLLGLKGRSVKSN